MVQKHHHRMACTAARNLFFFLTTTKKRSRFLLQIELIDVDKAALTTKNCSEKFFFKVDLADPDYRF